MSLMKKSEQILNLRNFDSVGGYLIGVLGTFPENGQEIESEGIRFIVEEVDKNRIKKVRIFT